MAQRILLVQLADIGDLILTTPAIAALREAKPDAHLTLLTTTHSAPIVEDTGLVNEIVKFDRAQFNSSKAFFQPANLRRILGLRGGQYDTIIYFHHFTLKAGTLKFGLIALAVGAKRRIGLQNGNGWFLTESIPDGGFGAKHQAEYWLDLVGLCGAETKARPAVVKVLTPAPSPLSVYAEGESKPRIIIHPGSGGFSLARRWSPEQFAAAADQLHRELNAEIILVGGKNDDTATVKAAMQAPVNDLTGKTTLAELAGVIQAADVFIGAESGVMHLAAAVGTPLVAIFGPGNPAAWGPWTPESPQIVVRSAPECSPCSYIGHGLGLREGCEARTCIRMVTAAQVVKAAKKLLSEAKLNHIPETSNEHRQDAYFEHSIPPLRLRGGGEGVGSASALPDASDSRFPRRIEILGLPVDGITYAEWLDLIGRWVRESDRPRHVCTTNPEFMIVARRDPNFRNILQRCDLCVPDGVGLLYAARLMGTPLPERVTGSDGVPIIAERAATEGWRLFLLGAAPGIAAKTAEILQERYPGLQIAGTYSGSPAAGEEDAIVELINASKTDILLVAYGAPQQDKWIARNLPRLQINMAMGVGGSFDFIAGIIPRAPLWMRRAGLEWLYRLYLQPSRIGRMMRLPRFALLVLWSRFISA